MPLNMLSCDLANSQRDIPFHTAAKARGETKAS